MRDGIKPTTAASCAIAANAPNSLNHQFSLDALPSKPLVTSYCEHLCDLSMDDRVAASSSTNAVNFSSARTTKRFPSPRCASAIQIVRPLESTAYRNRAGSRLLLFAEFLE